MGTVYVPHFPTLRPRPVFDFTAYTQQLDAIVRVAQAASRFERELPALLEKVRRIDQPREQRERRVA